MHQIVMLLLDLLFITFLVLSTVKAKKAEPCPQVFCPPDCDSVTLDSNGCRVCGNCSVTRPLTCAEMLCPLGKKCVEFSFGCENIPKGTACDPMISARCEPVCPDAPCAIRCQYGLAHDENGCQLCECLPNPCAALQCLAGTTCEVVPNDSCEGFQCPPFKAVCSLLSSCKPQPCKMLCPFGFENDEAGCSICKCRADPCATIRCKANYTCQVEQLGNCKKPPCPYVGVCVYNCPMLKCKECLSGNVIDANGCRTCQCKNPCEGVTCPNGGVCTADLLTEEGYRCSTATDLCCEKPRPPKNCTATYNVCQNCFKDCTTMKCGGSTRCCPDYFGCYGCRSAIPC